MSPAEADVELRYADTTTELGIIEPLWNALHEHHSQIEPMLAGSTPKRDLSDAWALRRAKYESWLKDPDTFFVLAEREREPVGYAFVTLGLGYASWATGSRLAELETLSVLPAYRGAGIGEALLEAVWSRLARLGVDDLAITTATANIGSHRFYERHGFAKSFAVYYRKRDPA